jgi:hypothetical protein
LPYIEGHDGVDYSLIIDSMSGQYCVFGQILYQSDNYTGGLEFTYINFTNLDSDKLKNKYKEIFEIDMCVLIAEPYMFAFSHYS